MSLLDLFKKSRLKTNTPDGTKPTPYQDSVVKMRNVKFPANLSIGTGFEDYTRFEETGAVAGSPAPVLLTEYLVTEDSDFLMTENNDNLVITDEIV